MITNSDYFYLAAVRKNSQYCKKENLLFELMEDIDHQGIKKLVDKNGELTNVGKQNLKFSIEKYQESNLSKLTNKNSLFDLILHSNEDQAIKNNFGNSQLIKSKNEAKLNQNNNIGENQGLNKNSKRKDKKIKIRKNSYKIIEQIKNLKLRNLIIIGIIIFIIICIIIYLII